jgi:hypothetical protein
MTIIETSNGHVKGRAAPAEKLESLTFEGTGRTVSVRKLPTFWRDTLRKQVRALPGFEEPQPPTVEVDYGEGKLKREHRGHPIYQELLKEWRAKVEREVGERVTPFVIRRGVVCEVDPDAVAERRKWAAEDGLDLSEFDDHYIYVAFCCIGPFSDWTDLLKAVFERSSPQEAATAEYKAAFQGDVRQPGPVEPELRPATGPDGA